MAGMTVLLGPILLLVNDIGYGLKESLPATAAAAHKRLKCTIHNHFEEACMQFKDLQQFIAAAVI